MRAEPPDDPAAVGEETPLVALVVVSHSRALAGAAVGLASEMLAGRPVRIEVAAGLDETTFGTDAVQIQEAIERADGPAGVVVLMDLGSAVLSAELALELLTDPSAHERVLLSPAPIVEGLVVAAVAAAGGASRAEVAAEAGAALLAKAEHLGDPAATASMPAGPPPGGGGPDVVAVIKITSEHGLHARPAARLVGALSGLDADVRLTNLTTGAGPVPARSLSRVATLAALTGHRVQVGASGSQAQLAVDRLVQLAGRNFDESPAPTSDRAASTSLPTARPAGRGPLPGAPGIAIGPARRLDAVAALVNRTPAGDPDAEWSRLGAARDAVRRELATVSERTRAAAGEQEAGIFAAHAALLDDGHLLTDVRRRIDAGDSAAAAWSDVLVRVEAEWAALPDAYLRERSADVRAVREQVLRALDGTGPGELSGPGILVTSELSPADAAGLDLALVTGVVLAGGSPTSHAAILARARDVPLVVAAGPEVLEIRDGTRLVIDGGAGELVVSPDEATVGEFARRATVLADERARDLAAAGDPAVTRDGTAVAVAANIGSVADARAAAAAGADGSGLVRTEFLFLGRSAPPSRDEQQTDYAAIAAALAGRRITVRTLDVGGDKPLTYLPMAAEANPFLGLRGIRLLETAPSVLADQLAAICAVARTAPINVMFPMVSTLSELLEARAVLADVAGPQGPPAGLRVGIMIEVPAAALKIETFLPHLDFVSIGTNDLTQYTLAAERGNPSVAELSDPLDPSVLALIDRAASAASAGEGRIEVSVCGDAAADPVAVPLLLGLGVRSLSVSPAAVPAVKAVVRGLDLAACRDLAQLALSLADAGQVRDLVRRGR